MISSGCPREREPLDAVGGVGVLRRGEAAAAEPKLAQRVLHRLLIPAYLHGWLVTGEERYRRVVEQTVEYALRELRLDGGGFASAQDADTDGVEGLTFTWTPEENDRPELLQPFEHGRFILRGDLDDGERARLLAIREQRPQPERDDKAIAGWNGLMLAALAEAARRLERDDWLQSARELGEFLLGPLADGERLHRTWRDGVAKGTGYLEDYANVAHGLYELHVATGDARFLHESYRLARLAIELFADDEHGGFFLTPFDGESLVSRKKDLDDNPTPSGNSMLAFHLLRLARLWGDEELERRAVETLRLVRDVIPRAPQGFGWALCASISTSRRRGSWRWSAAPGALLRGRRSPPSTRTRSSPSAPPTAFPCSRERRSSRENPPIYACERFACRAPVTDPTLLADR